MIEQAVARAVNASSQIPAINDFLGPEIILVPAPRSAPLRDHAALWPGRLICESLTTHGLGRVTLPCLSRTEAVPKSAVARPGERATAERHMETMAVEKRIIDRSRITIVDDVVTKGRTLFAAASLMQAAYPEVDVRVFALVRTCGLTPEVDKILDPCVGEIRFLDGDVDREP
ncbi:MAG: phosphoribosyltransferase [Planctomycetes bacterium]|nr:phosphoribosyltransferase [Planctomycetota bacterium]